jgi:type II secretory ATPase GspE/PulE/Tfp pilus assembly ATPase PilB-like protein
MSDVPKIGQILIQKKKLSPTAVGQILTYLQQNPDERFGTAAIRLGHATEADVLAAYAEQMEIVSRLTTPTIDKLTIDDIDVASASAARVDVRERGDTAPIPWIPLQRKRIAVADLYDFLNAAEILNRLGLGQQWGPVLAPATAISAAWVEIHKVLSSDHEDMSKPRKIIENIIRDAYQVKASDIHIRPSDKEDGYAVTFRVHGMMDRRNAKRFSFEDGMRLVRSIFSVPNWGLNANEKTLPQDGAGQLDFEGRPVRFRISTIPLGENRGTSVVIRLLPGLSGEQRLSSLNYSPHVVSILKKIIHAPHGLLLVTGPTGSGKSTLLYVLLTECYSHNPNRNLISIEDPIEAQLPFVAQIYGPDDRDLTEEQKAQGVPTMTSVQRNVLRHDPDVILIGEMRDINSARAGIRNAQTGHLVFSTLHANRAAGVITRLIEMDNPGIPAGIVADVLLSVVSQLLMPVICPQCRVEADPGKVANVLKEFRTRVSEAELKRIDDLIRERGTAKPAAGGAKSWKARAAAPANPGGGISDVRFWDYPTGEVECAHCLNRRRVGRVPVAEVILMSRADRTALQEGGKLPLPIYSTEQDILYRCANGEVALSELEEFLVVS